MTPCRNPNNAKQTARFFKLTRLNKNKVGQAQSFAGPQVSFDRPEKSPCLASLKTKPEVYAEVLAIIQAGKASLAKRPRADMPGAEFVLNSGDRKSLSRLLL